MKGNSTKTSADTLDLSLLHALIDESNAMVFIIDMDTLKFVYINETTSKKLGYSFDEMQELGLEGFRKSMPNSISLSRNFNELEIEKDGILDYAILVKADGSEIYIEENIRIVEFNNRSYKIAIVHDITDRQRDEQQFHSLIENIPGTVYRCLLDKDWTMLYINKEIEKLTGYPASGFLVENPAHTFAEFIHPDDLQPIWENTNKAVEEKTFYINEYRMYHQDGSIRDVLARGKAIYDKDGVALYLDGSIFDITEMREAQRELAKSKEENQNYLDVAQVLIMALDIDNNVVMINQAGADILGYSKDEIIGKNWIDKFIPVSAQKNINAIADEIIKNIDNYNEYINPILTKSGEEKTIVWKNKSLFNDEGKVNGILTSGYDITKQQNVEKELIKIQENLKQQVKEEVEKRREKDQQLIQQSRLAQMGEMISMIAHQWRQPLGAIASTSIDMKLQSEFEKFDLGQKEEAQEYEAYINNGLDNIDGLVQNLTTTIDDFRSFFKPNKEADLVLIKEPVQKALKIVRSSLEFDGIEIVERCIICNKKSKIYSNEITQVVLNILKNSQDNFKEKSITDPKITIVCECHLSDIYCLKIFDNGGGIPEDIIDKIFDPYFSTKAEKMGLD